VQNSSQSSCDDLQLPEKQTTKSGVNITRRVDSPGISDFTNLTKYLLVERDERITLQDRLKCVIHLRTVA
jgi:hypothetical protein